MRTSIILNIALLGLISCQNNTTNLPRLSSDSLNKKQVEVKKEIVCSSINRIDTGYKNNNENSFSFAKFRLNEHDSVIWHRMDSTIFHYKDYDISTISMDGEVGEEIWIFIHKSKELLSFNKIFNYGATYFVDIVNSNLIIDAGTSATRGLYVFNVLEKKMRLDATYVNSLELKDSKLKFMGIVKGQQSKTLTCQEGELYEEFVFSLNDNSLNKTGKYDCIVGE